MKKLSNSKGFTLAEVLIATAILAIFVSMAFVGTSTMFDTGEKMMSISKAAILGSDVMKTVTNEIRFGENFSINGSSIHYNSTTYGEDCDITLNDEGELIVVQTATSTNASGETIKNEKTFLPIGSASYDEVYIKSIVFSIAESSSNAERQIITCEVSITDGEKTLWSNSITVVPLYQKTIG